MGHPCKIQVEKEWHIERDKDDGDRRSCKINSGKRCRVSESEKDSKEFQSKCFGVQ
jgi:hypothetical protein